jgi:phosphoglycolate phosphatase
MFLCEPYDGIIDLLNNLRTQNKKLFIATSKPEVYTKEILKNKNLINFFYFVGGADLEEKKRVEKIDVINYVLKQNHLIQKKDSIVMIGDRSYDINGAHLAGLKAIGILWGFGNKEEFINSNADWILKTPIEVFNLLNSEKN